MTARETVGFGGVGRVMKGFDEEMGLVWFGDLGGDGFKDMHVADVAIVAAIGRRGLEMRERERELRSEFCEMVLGILEGWISGSERLLDTSLIQGGELEIFVRFEPLILCHASLSYHFDLPYFTLILN